ncbi:MAG: class I SAM-dependent methyltransferase [Stomatobaculum sp.]|nr:class I SAM-dependent methyltransferase [Stomatobaculum sp.]
MKKKKDAALEYMLKLGIFPAKSPSGALEQLRNVMDPETLKEVLTAEETEGDPQAFYRVKNRTLDTALTVSGAFGGDVLRKACGLIDAAPEVFCPLSGAGIERSRPDAAEGSAVRAAEHPCFRVAEAGCDCGIVSCFIAQRYPDAEVTGADLCAEGISAAEKLAEKLGLSNVRFVNGAADTLEAGAFDVVFSLRTMHENCDVEEPEAASAAEGPENAPAGTETAADLLRQYEEACFEALRSYASGIAAILKAGGRFLSVERRGGSETVDALGNAYERALEAAELTGLPEMRRQLVCTEVGRETVLEVRVFVKTPHA